MQTIADALVYATAYISLREDEAEEFLDAAVGTHESIAAIVELASRPEQDALAEAAERALAVELAWQRPRETFVAEYRTWMEDTRA